MESKVNAWIDFLNVLVQVDKRMKKEGKTYGSEGKRNSNNTN